MECLREDHESLRELLMRLDVRLELGEAARPAIHEISLVLAAQLRGHVQREGRLAVACSRLLGTWNAQTLARFAVDHHTDQAYLRVITRCAAKPSRCAFAALRPSLNGLRVSLRLHMDQQETELFPFLEEMLDRHRQPSGTGEPPAGVNGSLIGRETMVYT
ncbi:MAG: hemerythrin domain-containing protein [Candidatus Omnitrophica bacterium]|nr:hemerythrin domain-containing protein [Candidatus Omnitrophota bacterium]